MNAPILTDEEVRKKGLDVLARELGQVNSVRFLQMNFHRTGDYTAEREELLKGITLEQILADIEAQRAKEQP